MEIALGALRLSDSKGVAVGGGTAFIFGRYGCGTLV